VRRLVVPVVVALVVASLGMAVPVHAARRTPGVEFRPVLASLPPAAATSSTLAPADRVDAALKVASCDAAAVQALPVVPTTASRTAKADDCVVFPETSGGPSAVRYYLGPAADLPVKDARSQFVTGQGWTVKIDFTKAGARAWDRLAEAQFHDQVAITYEGGVVAAPTIQPANSEFESFGGVGVISADFTQKEAAALAGAARLARGR
jgi:preprotein translocase subunit SecD